VRLIRIIFRIILISVLVIFDVAAVRYFVFMPLSAISFIGLLFCDRPGATPDQCVGKAMSVFLPIALVAYAPFITVFVLVNVITIRFLIDT
jgi:hypothetical protein